MKFILSHSTLGWSIIDLLALIILVSVSVYAYKQLKALKQKKQELEKRLAGEQSEVTVTVERESKS